MPLTLAAAGEVNTIKMIRGKIETVRHLESMGFVEDARVALNKELASKIMI